MINKGPYSCKDTDTWHCHFTWQISLKWQSFPGQTQSAKFVIPSREWRYWWFQLYNPINFSLSMLWAALLDDWRVVLGFCNFEGYIFCQKVVITKNKKKKIFDHTWLYEQKPWRNWANTKPGPSICSGMWTWYTFRKFWTNKARVRAHFRSKKSYTPSPTAISIYLFYRLHGPLRSSKLKILYFWIYYVSFIH